MTRVLPLEAASHPRHPLHSEDRIWVEKNCYIDLWIEVLHALGVEPLAVMPFTLSIDFEDDQWTFFKPPHGELWDLYGIDVEELTVWKPLVEHCATQLAAGKFVSTDADAFFLPDTSGTDYRRNHTKTTIVVNDLDLERRRLGYFHNAGYYALEGDDFAGLFRLGLPHDPAFLPLFAELVRVGRVVVRSDEELRAISRRLLQKHLARRPADNPIARFGRAFEAELPKLHEAGLEHYHLWAFAGVRQLGAAFELAALYVDWLDPALAKEVSPHFTAVSAGAKTFILKAARAVNGKRALDARPMFDEMAAAWEAGMARLDRAVERPA
ncbi:MAG TPA: DUF1839 family protein [Polyangiaceae bacterium]|nr:DUF1839 family protein [Polyangiaceae bacterium]